MVFNKENGGKRTLLSHFDKDEEKWVQILPIIIYYFSLECVYK